MNLCLQKLLLFSTVATALVVSPSLAPAQDQPDPGGWEVQPEPQVDALEQSDAQVAPVLAGPAPGGAVAAMLAIDPKYTDGILLVTGPNGHPAPPKWIVLARDSDDLGTLHKLTVADGQVIADVLSLNAYQSFRQKVAINPVSVQVDSGDAFLIAQTVAAANQKIPARVDYALTVRGTDAAPIWTVNCFSEGGGFLGKVILLATTGAILDQPGFPKQAPALSPSAGDPE